MTSKTIVLTGEEIKVEYSGGCNAWLRNDGTATVYASTAPGISAGADGTVSIPAGQSVGVYGANGTVYLKGTGSVQLIGSDYSTNPFRNSAASGGSGADEQARAAIEAHAGNADIHVTADEKAGWDAKAELSDIPTTLPANGGNADTLDGFHANEIASNPNLLINPDFKINQRGYQMYHAHGGLPSTETEKYNADYLVDGWKFIYGGESAEVTDDGIVLTLANNQGVKQPIDSKLLKSLGGKIVSFSIDCELVSGNYASFSFNNKSGNKSSATTSETGRQKLHFTDVIPDGISDTDGYFCAISGDGVINVYSVKMEVGSAPTEFLPPDPTLELLKCQRYYQVRTTNNIEPLDMRPSMKTITDIKAVEGGYAYVAEL